MSLFAFAAAIAAAGPVEAERAFAAAAQTEGQWTAFRHTAAGEAVLFVPEPVNAQTWLKDRADPPAAVMWWPAEAYVSCDGRYAATTGPWVRNGGKLVGYFTTVWERQPGGGWKWLVDHADVLEAPRPAGDAVPVREARCTGEAPYPIAPVAPNETKVGGGRSPDGSLTWLWYVDPSGARRLNVFLREGSEWAHVIRDVVEAPE